MSSILNLAQHAIDSVPELELLPAGSEAEVRITNVNQGVDKNGNDYIMPFYDVPDEPNVAEISDYIPLPDDKCDEKELNRRKRKLLAFGEAFDIDWSGDVDLEALAGSTGYVIVGINKDGDQNTVRKYLGGK